MIEKLNEISKELSALSKEEFDAMGSGMPVYASADLKELDDFSFHMENENNKKEIENSLNSWKKLKENWDGENGSRPVIQSIDDALEFLKLIDSTLQMPEPMLQSSGRASLLWSEGLLYIEIEFNGSGGLAYYMSINNKSSKGSAYMKDMKDIFVLIEKHISTE